MPLLIGITLICLTALWLAVLLIGGRNPDPPWWARDWMLADVQVPSMMLLAIIGVWFMTRFFASPQSGVAIGTVEILAAAGVVVVTGLIIRQMKVGRRLKQFAEMEADAPPEGANPAGSARMITLQQKLPWQVRLHLADELGYDLAWIRSLRCVVREIADPPGHLRFLAFDPDQASAQGVVITDPDTLDGHPELVVFSGTFAVNGQQMTVDSTLPRRAAA